MSAKTKSNLFILFFVVILALSSIACGGGGGGEPDFSREGLTSAIETLPQDTGLNDLTSTLCGATYELVLDQTPAHCNK